MSENGLTRTSSRDDIAMCDGPTTTQDDSSRHDQDAKQPESANKLGNNSSEHDADNLDDANNPQDANDPHNANDLECDANDPDCRDNANEPHDLRLPADDDNGDSGQDRGRDKV